MGRELSERGAKQTILGAAVAMAVPLLTAEEADKQILDLLQQVGDLECANGLKDQTIKIMEEKIKALAHRNAALEDGIKAISAHCALRKLNLCDLGCGGRSFCVVDGLIALPFGTVVVDCGGNS